MSCVLFCLIFLALHRPNRNGYHGRIKLFIFNGAIFRSMLSISNSMTVLALGLVVGIALNETSVYHAHLVGLQMTILTYSVFLVHYFIWSTRKWYPKLGDGE